VHDLLAFANRSDVDPIVQAAVLHAQFETIHPYGDGNGRLGRVLISWLLARRLTIAVPPPLSVLIVRDPGGYLSGLHQFREGTLDPYIGWFADIARRAGDSSVELGARIESLLDEWRERTSSLRVDAAGRRLVDVLPELPIVNSSLVADRLHISDRAARSALDELGNRAILVPVRRPFSAAGRPRRWWVAPELLDIVRAWPG
jgi:Fic family protein